DVRAPRLRKHCTGTRLDAKRVSGNVHVAVEMSENRVEFFGEAFRLRYVVEEHHKLVAAEAADPDIVARKTAQPVRHGVDKPVSDRMTQRVVDALEVVE